MSMRRIVLALVAIVAFAITGIIATYFPRVPAAVASAFASMVTAHFASATPATETLLFWAVASTIAAGIRYLHGGRRNGNGYVATGTLAGTLLGYLISPTAASLICGGAAGAILAAIAYVRTPAEKKSTFIHGNSPILSAHAPCLP